MYDIAGSNKVYLFLTYIFYVHFIDWFVCIVMASFIIEKYVTAPKWLLVTQTIKTEWQNWKK